MLLAAGLFLLLLYLWLRARRVPDESRYVLAEPSRRAAAARSAT
jgi:hypothetical protein